MSARFAALFAVIAAVMAAAVYAQKPEILAIIPLDYQAIQYAEAPSDDPVARLNQQLAIGAASLDFRPGGLGDLPSVLEKLGVNPDSQMLVFSKTSFQTARISPRNPRALFFADNVMVGSVRGGDVLEFAALDPRQGFMFYTLGIDKSDQPRFIRRDSCLQFSIPSDT